MLITKLLPYAIVVAASVGGSLLAVQTSVSDIAVLKKQVNAQRVTDIEKADVARLKALNIVCEQNADQNAETAKVRKVQARSNTAISKDKFQSATTRKVRRQQGKIEGESIKQLGLLKCKIGP